MTILQFYILQRLVHPMQTTPLQDILVLPSGFSPAILGIAHYSRHMASALLRLHLVCTNCMLIQKLHRIQCYNTDYAMMPPAFHTSLMLPWEIKMEEYSKLWENEVFVMWKAGSPGVDVGLAMNFVCTCCMEYDAQRMILDISDATIIRYPAA